MDIYSIFIIFVLSVPNFARSKIEATCSDDLKIDCPTGKIVLIAVAQAERMVDECRYGREKENPKLKELIWDLCSDKETCQIPFDHQMADYMYLSVTYDCGVRHNLCSDVTITGNTSYLESPNFWKSYPYRPKESCVCKAEIETEQEFRVWFTDYKFNTSEAHVTIFWDNTTESIHPKTKRRDANNLKFVAEKEFKIRFEAGQDAGSGQFQLRYETDRSVKMVCNPGTSKRPKLLIFLIAPIALVCLLIFITIVICIVKRRNAAKRKKSGKADSHDMTGGRGDPHGMSGGMQPRDYYDQRMSDSSYSSCSTCGSSPATDHRCSKFERHSGGVYHL